jgi:hypothetical protein
MAPMGQSLTSTQEMIRKLEGALAGAAPADLFHCPGRSGALQYASESQFAADVDLRGRPDNVAWIADCCLVEMVPDGG